MEAPDQLLGIYLIRDKGLSPGLRAILRENGGTWSITKYLTFSQLMQPRVEAPGQLLGIYLVRD